MYRIKDPMPTNITLLRAVIKKKGLNYRDLAEGLHMCLTNVYRRLNYITPFSREDARQTKMFLNLSKEESIAIFGEEGAEL